MLDKLKLKLFGNKLSYISKLKIIKGLKLDIYESKFLHLHLDFINDSIITDINDLNGIINGKVHEEIIQVKMISKETIKYKTFRDWFTDKGFILSNPNEVLNNWVDVSIKFLKLCKEADVDKNTKLAKNYRRFKPYQNAIEIITDFILDNI